MAAAVVAAGAVVPAPLLVSLLLHAASALSRHRVMVIVRRMMRSSPVCPGVPPVGLEPTTNGVETRCSIH